MFDDIPHELLMRAFEAEIDERMAALPDDLPEPVYSKRFLRKMRALTRSADRSKAARLALCYAKRAAVVLLTLLTVSTITVLSVDALRERLFRFVVERHEKYSQISFEPTSPDHAGTTEEIPFCVYAPSYIPEGFVEVTSLIDPAPAILEWEDAHENTIAFLQNLVAGSARMKINTEGVPLLETTVNGCPAHYYSNDGTQTLIWYDEVYWYTVSSNLSKEEVYKIAISTKS